MAEDREQRIRLRAYTIWEREGRPEGREQEHWEQARREIEAEDRAGAAPAREELLADVTLLERDPGDGREPGNDGAATQPKRRGRPRKGVAL